ncbi:hypothetical protein [Auritidibacter ignavus]|uniref:hypothetical protein n=1 Tax=Auritidibacter ignavus TaxID=678932 RepID=UPI001604A3A1|nr:hypothetical protein [Auritidibacter ignavus]
MQVGFLHPGTGIATRRIFEDAIGILKVDGEEEALRMANYTDFKSDVFEITPKR